MRIGDDVAGVLAHALVGNETLRSLLLLGEDEDEENILMTLAGWSAFSKVLCDTSSVNNTYLSNHTIQELWEENGDYEDIDPYLARYLQLNKRCPQHAAKCKILMNHTHLDMAPLLRWGPKFLPLAVGWFEKAKPCMTLPNEDESPILEESDEVFQSRILSALYEFVRGVPKKVLERRGELILVAAYDDKVTMLRQEKKRLFEDVAQRDGTITQLKGENKRLEGIVESVRNTVNY